MSSQSESKIVGALQRLVVQGWLPLRQVGILLGYAYPNSIYQREDYTQRAIKVGSTFRVYTADVLRILDPENAPEQDKEILQMILVKYNQLLKEQSCPEHTSSYQEV